MNGVNKTLYIPLYGKAYVSQRGLFLSDKKAEAIWAAEGFPLKGKARSKWLAYNMGMRSAVFDRWLQEKMEEVPNAVILHLGCGMDSRIDRVGTRGHLWFDVDFPEVIDERRRYFPETDHYRMVPSDIRDASWLEQIPRDVPAILVMEGISMYLTLPELKAALKLWNSHFSGIHILMDTYTTFAAKATKYKNPINTVGVTQVYGFDDPEELCGDTGLTFLAEHSLTPDHLIARLHKSEQLIFQKLFAGNLAKKIYRLYEYKT